MMRKAQLVTFLLLGASLQILGAARWPTQSADRRGLRNARAAGPKEPGEEPNRGRNPRPELDPALAAYRFDGTLPTGSPPTFEDLDKDGDGRISRYEWRMGGQNPERFADYDLDGDGFITVEEVLQYMNRPVELTLAKGRANYQGTLTAADEKYRGGNPAKLFTVKLEKGKPYQIDLASRELDVSLYLEDSEGNLLAEGDNGRGPRNACIRYRAARGGTCRLVATSAGPIRSGAFSLSVRDVYGFAISPKHLPPWFNDLDRRGDGKISREQWRNIGKDLDDFRRYDRNNDEFVTADEAFHHVETTHDLRLQNGRLTHTDALKTMAEERYLGKQSFKVFAVRLESGKTYRIDLTSPAFQSFLYLEDPDGEPLMEHSADNIGGNARLVYRAATSGTYRVVATSLAGVRTGRFTLSIRTVSTLADSLPPWFKELAKAEGGRQISLAAWRERGLSLDEFHKYDLNGDGFITADEVLRLEKLADELKLRNGWVEYEGTVEEMAEARYQGKKSFKVLTVRLEEGTTYQIDLVSPLFQSYLYLEDPEGELLMEHSADNVGSGARLAYRAAKSGTYRIIATSLAGVRTGPFALWVRVVPPLDRNLPPWFKQIDQDGDGQITLAEWRASGRSLDEFRGYDLNDDGVITADEVLRLTSRRTGLKLQNGRAHYEGTVEEMAEELYQGKKSFKALTVRLVGGTTYQFDLASRAFQAFLYLEDPAGEIVMENSAPNIGGNSRLVYRAEGAGTYRIIVTSLGGFKTGPFALSVRVISSHGDAVPKELPPWFKELDRDGDGQISLAEWRRGGRSFEEFRQYDLNRDGFITPDEVLRLTKQSPNLRLQNGRARYEGSVEDMGEEQYDGKQSFKVLTARLEAGKTYQIDMVSPAFPAHLYLEDLDGEVATEGGAGNVGGLARLVYRAAKSGTYRIIATSMDGVRTGPFALAVRVVGSASGGHLPHDLPPWFKELSKEAGGQISLAEWRRRGRSVEEFDKYDLNRDGFITADEVLHVVKQSPGMRLQNGRLKYEGTVEEMAEDRYQGKRSFSVLSVRLEAGKTYQFDLASQSFQSYLYVEDSDGDVVAEAVADNVGGNAHLVHRAAHSGSYRIIVTSAAGVRTGPFALSVRLGGSVPDPNAPKELPPWFKELDLDGDGQISFAEWRAAGKDLDEFRKYDLNNDGFITEEELLRYLKAHPEPKKR
jgi:Ca2+-binding EF-hand superfamily protein